MTTRAPKIHRVVDGTADWTCSCGKSAADTAGTIEQHQAKAAREAFRRLEDYDAGTRISTGDWADNTLFGLVYPWTRGGYLRTYATPFYDRLGLLRAQLDWPAVVAAIDAGKLTDDDHRSTTVLRIAASLAGHCSVNLRDELGPHAIRDVDQRVEVLKAMARVLQLPVKIEFEDDSDD